MTTAIGIVMTDHIVAGRLEDHRLIGKPLRYPDDPSEVDALRCHSRQRTGRDPGRQIARYLAESRSGSGSTRSVSRCPESSAMEWSKTRPI